MEWPFADERAFWRWAFNPDAEVVDNDEDLLLRHPDGLHLLLTAAADPGCPKHDYCANVLADYTCAIIRWGRTELYPRLRVAAEFALTLPDPLMHEWSTHVTRLLAYQQPAGPVNRATAEQMAGDLLGGPIRPARPTVHITPDNKHWESADPSTATVVQIDRRTGTYRFTQRAPFA